MEGGAERRREELISAEEGRGGGEGRRETQKSSGEPTLFSSNR